MKRICMVLSLMSASSLTLCAQDDVTSFREQFESIRNSFRSQFEDFRREANAEFVKFAREAWEHMEAHPALDLPEDDEKLPPPVFSNPETKPTNPVVMPIKEIVEPMPYEPEPQPEPVSPIEENNESTEEFTFTSFGTKLTVRLDKSQRFTLKDVSESSVADKLEKLYAKEYDNLIYDCLQLRRLHKLSDWGYFQMLKHLSESFLGKDTNESALFTAFLMQQSGYKMRMGRANGRLYVLINTEHKLIGYNYFELSDGDYYVMDGDVRYMELCNVAFRGEKTMSLYVPAAQDYDVKEDAGRTLTSKKYRNASITYQVNENLINFFDTYPTSVVNNDKMTRWAMYANTPMDPYVAAQIYPQLNGYLATLTLKERVSALLDLCQTSLDYEYDNKIWGHDRAFFAEETLHYPYADCEDRSILFTRLVRDLLELDCILIYCPGHLAAGVCFGDTTVSGDYYDVKGKRFVVCDPTYIDAPVGMSMDIMKESEVDVVILNR